MRLRKGRGGGGEQFLGRESRKRIRGDEMELENERREKTLGSEEAKDDHRWSIPASRQRETNQKRLEKSGEEITAGKEGEEWKKTKLCVKCHLERVPNKCLGGLPGCNQSEGKPGKKYTGK